MDSKDSILQSMTGLSVGDAFGQALFSYPHEWIAARRLPEAQWIWTDDTHMALSITEVLLDLGTIDEDELARRFARRFSAEPWRGYGSGARRLLWLYSQGADWRTEAPKLFNGGSYGNGAAMRAAPIGAFFGGEPERAREEAVRSAIVTHAHVEGQAGAIAVAVAGCLRIAHPELSGSDLLKRILPYLPPCETRDRIVEAAKLSRSQLRRAITTLGSGQQIAAFDTVPFCLWVAAHHGASYEDALWTTASGSGDLDTTCAIVGGIVASSAAVPERWIQNRAPLPSDFIGQTGE
jgi:ADP-ribosylglycohydrolase